MLARLKLVGLALVAVLAVAAVVASSASALQWLINGKPITSAQTVKSSGTLKLADLVAGTTIECEGTGEGTVGPGASDTVTELKATSCKFVKQGSCEAESKFKPTAEPLNLPYVTLLGDIGSHTVDTIKPGSSGKSPGWNVKCGVGGILKVQDECTSPKANTLVANTAGGVTTEFLESETASCTLGNASSGMVTGTPLNKNPTGETLSVSNSPNT
jgi:hypothetical protein